jgi:hypothetical protein
MASNIDPSVVDVDGPVSKSATRDPDGNPGVYEQLVAAKDEIEALQGGTAIHMGDAEEGVPQLADKVLFRSVTDNVTYYSTFAEVRNATAVGTVIFAGQLGLTGDGVTDDSAILNPALQEISANGGGTVFLCPDPGGQFYFEHRVKVPSFVNLVFAGPRVKLAKASGIRIDGDYAETPLLSKYRLIADVTAGASSLRVDTSPQGGGLVSDHFVIRGMSDAAANSLETGEHVVTGLDDGTAALTVTPTLEYDYEVEYDAGDYEAATGIVDRTYISKLTQSPLTVDGEEGGNTVEVAASRVGLFSVGDYVIVEDDKLSSDVVAGGSSNKVHVEIAIVIAVAEDGANLLTLNRRLERTYETAYNARVIALDPARRASVQGCSVEFIEEPDASPASRYNTFEMIRAVNSAMLDCEVPNEDAFGARGAMFRFSYSYECAYVRSAGRAPKHLGSGDGYGCAAYYSTRCVFIEPTIAGCRHNILFQGATDCRALDVDLADDRGSSIDFHGLDEVGCFVSIAGLTGGSRSAFSSNTAIKFGNTSHMCGPRRCIVVDGRVGQYKASNSRVVQFEPGAEECVVRGIQCDDIATLLYHADNSGSGGLIAKRCSIEEAVVNGYSGKLVNVDGGRNGSASYTLEDLTIRDLRAYGGTQHIFLEQVAGCELTDIQIGKVTTDVTEPYAVTAVDVTGLDISTCRFKGVLKGIALTDCVAAIVDACRFISFADAGTEVLQDNGGNTDLSWTLNKAIGFVWSEDETGTPSTDKDFFPLPIDGTSALVVV